MKQASFGVRQILLVFVLPLVMGQAQLASQLQDASVSALAAQAGIIQQPFPHLKGTKPLTLPTGVPLPPEMTYPKRGSIYAVQLRQEEDYWLKQIGATPALRDKIWNPEFSSTDRYRTSLQRRRSDLRAMLGLLDLSEAKLRSESSVLQSGPIRIEDVSITLDEDFEARALLFVPQGEVTGAVIAIPGIKESREEFAGIAEGQEPAPWLKSLLDRRLAIAIPMTVEHTSDDYVKVRTSFDQQDRRLLLHRLGFIVGRTLVGLEVQQALALRDYLVTHFNLAPQRVALLGQGQGGMTALYAAAVDTNYWGASVVDYFQQREDCWQEPPDRELYGQLNEFGDAEVAALIAPRRLHITYTAGGAIPVASVQGELARARRFYAGLGKSAELTVTEAPGTDAMADAADNISTLGTTQPNLAPSSGIVVRVSSQSIKRARDEQFEKLHRYLARLDAKSDEVRAKRWRLLATPASERATRAEELRQDLRQLEGTVAIPSLPLNARTKLIQVTDKFVAYDVLLDTVPGVEAYGQLLVPRVQTDHLPAVICQHGLGGTPADITGVGSEPSVYHSLGSHLADLGYVVFAPYINVPIRQEILVDRLVRQAATLGKMRTSLELAKLHRIVDFLQSLPFVDPQRIAYYGLSYGGYSAIWMPPLEPRIKASVISGHFNDWRAKITEENATPFVSPEGKHYAYPTSFLLHPGADNFNWDALDRFTHVELIAAMWPRPVCVEYGDYDTTTTPGWHARAWGQVEEYKKAWGLDGLVAKVVRVHYNGIHEIHGVGTVDFLNRWIQPEQPAGRDYSYDLLEQQHGTSGLSDNSEDTLPYVTHQLDMNMDTAVEGRFYVSSPSPVFTGLALKLSKVGHPGDLVVRFGTEAGRGDIGEARISAETINPLFDLWYKAKLKPVRLDPSKLYYFWVGTELGVAPENCYVAYGPKPYGGKDVLPNFGLSYQVLSAGKNGVHEPGDRFEFMRSLLGPYAGGITIGQGAPPRKPNEVDLRQKWAIQISPGSDDVTETAARDLSQFLYSTFSVNVAPGRDPSQSRIELAVVPSGIEGVSSAEGFRIEVSPDHIRVAGSTSRGVMRGVYGLEDEMSVSEAPYVATGVTIRNCRYPRRLTCAVRPAGVPNAETSFPLVYTDGLLQRISHSGFNAIWIWLNTEEATDDSQIFPELNDPDAALRLARLDDVSKRARRFGIDVYLYLATGYNHHLTESFFQKHPEAKGYGWGPPMCTSTLSVRGYYAETTETIFRHAPLVKGLIVIYDSEGFWYCGNSERYRTRCPRCQKRTQVDIAAELLTTLDNAVHRAGGPDKDFIAWNYNVHSEWVVQLLPLLPKDIIVQPDFDKGMDLERDGVRNHTEDYNISSLGPPALFVKEYQKARSLGLTVTTKTENSISQEFIFVPYIPCMEQWYQRDANMRVYDLGGWFGNWFFYGFTSSRPEQIINRLAFDPAPPMENLLAQQAERDFGHEAAPYALRAWHDFSEGIRAYPYSDPVARYPGPVQKGPSQPFFIDASVKSYGRARAWQNDLKWTEPWGPVITAKYLGQVEQWYAKGNAELEVALRVAGEAYRPGIESELRIGRTIQTSTRSVLNLLDWLQVRERSFNAKTEGERRDALTRMEQIAVAERENAQGILPALEEDSRLGYASDGAGLIRGGLFDSDLVRWKLGEIDDLLLRQLPNLARGEPEESGDR